MYNILLILQQALDDFHVVKDIFIQLECCDHFNMPKIHSLQHYVKTIKNLGSLDSVKMENSECLHINYAKKVYAASNQKDYTFHIMK